MVHGITIFPLDNFLRICYCITMKVEEAYNLSIGDIITNTNTGQSFKLIEVIWDSRDPPEYLWEHIINKTIHGPEFWLWLLKDNWVKVIKE